MRPWNLLEVNYGHIKEHNYEVAVLPFGATEPHNLHLPYGMDLLEATKVGEMVCELAHSRGARPLLLPTIPYGTETNLREFPFAMNLNPTTLLSIVGDLVDSLTRSGIRKVVLLNSHGGNDLKPILREMYSRTEAWLCLCNWYQSFGHEYSQIFTNAEDHAGEMETSFCLAYFPDLVARRADGSLAADQGQTAEFRFEALREGWVGITRPWHLLTTNAGAGNPHAATAEKGQKMMDLVSERLATFLVELSAAELDERFPFL